MTERRWLRSGDPEAMHEYLVRYPTRHPVWSARKDRLLGCACVRRTKDLLPPEDLEHLDAIERVADGDGSSITLAHIYEQLKWLEASERRQPHALESLVALASEYPPNPLDPLDRTARGLTFARRADRRLFDAVLMTELAANANLVREVYGNPFRPVAVDPAWLTSDVVALARGIYAEKAFDRMPILADALQDAGCVNEDVLNHCRGPGPHVRGCWGVDLLLEKR